MAKKIRRVVETKIIRDRQKKNRKFKKNGTFGIGNGYDETDIENAIKEMNDDGLFDIENWQ